MEKNDAIPKYGDPRFIFTLGWHDEAKKDYLVVVDYKKKNEVMNARAKGTTIYELIDIYGGVDNVSEAFSAKDNAVYADVSNMPEFANDVSYQAIMEEIAAKVAELQKKKEESTPKVDDNLEKGQEEK